jgi:predicted cytidylate kinase
MNFRAITISGEVASGKSSVVTELKLILPEWKKINTGQRFRDFCASKGMTIQQVAELSIHTHLEFDYDQKVLLGYEQQIIVEGRLAGWLAKDFEEVFRVFCHAEFDKRVERYMQRDKTSKEQAIEDILYRDSRDIKKFYEIYGVGDYRDPAFYHLVIDTTVLSPSELAQIIVQKAGLYKN